MAEAQFGTQLKVGDYGHLPVTKAASVLVKVLYAEFGVSGNLSDDCIYLDTTTPATLDSVLTNKDLRLTPCQGSKVGTEVSDAATVEKNGAAMYVPTVLKYADLNNNAKYDKGDIVYITTAPGGADKTLAASQGPASWTLRITPGATHEAGTLLQFGDADFTTYKAAAPVQAFSLVERDDKVWFLVPHAVGSAPYDVKGALVIENAIRINANTPLQPAFKVIKLDVVDTIPAGDSFTAKAEVQNTGKGSGMGVIFSKVNGVIVDGQLTPLLSPGEKATLTMKGFAPLEGAFFGFEVGDQTRRINNQGGRESASASEISALKAELESLRAEVAALKEAPTAAASDAADATDAIKPQSAKQEKVGSPGPTIVFVLVAGLAAAVLARRNRA